MLDCLREGIDKTVEGKLENGSHVVYAFRELWDSINAKPKAVKIDRKVNHYVNYPFGGENETKEFRGKTWYVLPNPWVWVIEFDKVG